MVSSCRAAYVHRRRLSNRRRAGPFSYWPFILDRIVIPGPTHHPGSAHISRRASWLFRLVFGHGGRGGRVVDEAALHDAGGSGRRTEGGVACSGFELRGGKAHRGGFAAAEAVGGCDG